MENLLQMEIPAHMLFCRIYRLQNRMFLDTLNEMTASCYPNFLQTTMILLRRYPSFLTLLARDSLILLTSQLKVRP